MSSPPSMLADLPTAPWFRRLLVAGIIAGIVLLTFSVLQPFLVPLIWGAILAYVSWPANQRILRSVGGRPGVAAFVTTLLVTLAIIIPLIWLVLLLRVEALAAYAEVQAFLAADPKLPPALLELPWIGPWAEDLLAEITQNPGALREQFVFLMEESSVEVSRVIGGVGRNVAKLFFAVLSMFFLLRDGPRACCAKSARSSKVSWGRASATISIRSGPRHRPSCTHSSWAPSPKVRSRVSATGFLDCRHPCCSVRSRC
jgi:predicted PurR-regulated permease PerM